MAILRKHQAIFFVHSYVPGSLHEWGTSSLGLVVDRGVPQDEQLHHIPVTLPAGEGQRGVVVATRRHIDLGTRVKEKLGSLKMTLSVSMWGW